LCYKGREALNDDSSLPFSVREHVIGKSMQGAILQTNGKLARWFYTYEQHRKRFASFEDFVQWYNEVRVHESLDLETPERVFWLKLQEYIFEKAVRLLGL